VFSRVRRLLAGQHATSAPGEVRFPSVAYADHTRARIAALPRWQQAAFAAACAERLYPAYAAFRAGTGANGDDVVRRALDVAWRGAAGGSIAEHDPGGLVEQCVALIPGEGAGVTLPDHANDAISAAAYALQAAAELSDEAAGWAAACGTNALDSFLITSGIVPWTARTRAERAQMDQRVWQHDLVQAEVARREADLVRLGSADRDATVRALRAGATGISLLPLDLLDHDPSAGGGA
jgi:hypothetical protein